MNRSKIVATIGPKTCSHDALCSLERAGMNVARLNGSHGDLAWHEQAIKTIREAIPTVPILLDIPGRKIRTLQLSHEPTFDVGDNLILTTDKKSDEKNKIPISHDSLHHYISKGDTIFADDGTLRFTVVNVAGRDIICRAENGGTLRSRKGINVPSVEIDGDLVTDRDKKMIEFARSNLVDYVGISFVESAAHVNAIRSEIGGDFPKIVAKVENRGGMRNLEEVVYSADAIMIDRGDLAVETNLESVAIFQKRIISKALKLGKPVIVATEMLHSMISNPFPTKSEVSDITNAVLDGCSATMLSGETAVGSFPIEAVSLMRRVIDVTTDEIDVEYSPLSVDTGVEIPRAIDRAVSQLCRELPITKIIAITKSGYAARMISTHRLNQQILAVTDDPGHARSFNLYAGVKGVYVDIKFSRESTDHIVACIETLWRQGEVTEDDLILVTAVAYPRPGNRMNLLQTHHVSDLIDSLGWCAKSRAS